MFKNNFNGSLMTASGRKLFYRTANDGLPTLKVFNENEEFVLSICIEEELTPEMVVNRILNECRKNNGRKG